MGEDYMKLSEAELETKIQAAEDMVGLPGELAQKRAGFIGASQVPQIFIFQLRRISVRLPDDCCPSTRPRWIVTDWRTFCHAQNDGAVRAPSLRACFSLELCSRQIASASQPKTG